MHIGWAKIAVGLGLLLVASLGLGVAYEALTARWDAARFPPPGRRVDIGGRALHLQCSGQGSPTVWIEAGGTGGSAEYEPLRAQLAAFTRACAYDRAGMGWSDPRPGPLDAGRLMRDFEMLLQRAGEPGPYVLVAGSAGGLTSELFARHHPDDVAGLVFLDALHAEMLDDAMQAGTDRLLRRASVARALAYVGLLRWVDPYDLGRLPPEERDRAMALKYHASTWDAVVALIGAHPETRTSFAGAPPLPPDVPLVVITHDPAHADQVAIPEAQWHDAQARLADRSTRGRLVVAEGSGHHPEQDRPDLVLEHVRELVTVARAP